MPMQLRAEDHDVWKLQVEIFANKPTASLVVTNLSLSLTVTKRQACSKQSNSDDDHPHRECHLEASLRA